MGLRGGGGGSVWLGRGHSRMHVKEWRTRRWRHMDTCQFKTILEAAVPDAECAEHGAQTVQTAQTVQVPWAEGSSRFTRA